MPIFKFEYIAKKNEQLKKDREKQQRKPMTPKRRSVGEILKATIKIPKERDTRRHYKRCIGRCKIYVVLDIQNDERWCADPDFLKKAHQVMIPVIKNAANSYKSTAIETWFGKNVKKRG